PESVLVPAGDDHLEREVREALQHAIVGTTGRSLPVLGEPDVDIGYDVLGVGQPVVVQYYPGVHASDVVRAQRRHVLLGGVHGTHLDPVEELGDPVDVAAIDHLWIGKDDPPYLLETPRPVPRLAHTSDPFDMPARP